MGVEPHVPTQEWASSHDSTKALAKMYIKAKVGLHGFLTSDSCPFQGYLLRSTRVPRPPSQSHEAHYHHSPCGFCVPSGSSSCYFSRTLGERCGQDKFSTTRLAFLPDSVALPGNLCPDTAVKLADYLCPDQRYPMQCEWRTGSTRKMYC